MQGSIFYNNGFSAGLICIVVIPLIEALKRETPE
jgi:3-isopropylmalate dehydratase small subunit